MGRKRIAAQVRWALALPCMVAGCSSGDGSQFGMSTNCQCPYIASGGGGVGGADMATGGARLATGGTGGRSSDASTDTEKPDASARDAGKDR